MKIFYHNDNDGKAAAAILYQYFKKQNINLLEEDFISINYNDRVPTAELVENNETVFIVDYSFNKNTVNNLYEISNKVNGNVFWYDHHKSSLEVLNKIISDNVCVEVIIDMDRCGAKIVFDTFEATYIINRYVIDLVDDYDRWIHKYPESMWFNIGSTMNNTHPTSDIWIDSPNKIINNGKLIKEYNDAKNSNIVKNNAYTIVINNHDCIVLNTAERSSQVFAEFFNEYKFAIVWNFNGNNFTYSIYSNLEDIDCSQIAKYFNPKGGGHKGAAGFVSDKLLFTSGSGFVI